MQDINNVYGFGHTSLLIQEKPGSWWYFYWGNNDIQLLYFGTGTLRDLNKFLHGYKSRSGKAYNNKWGYNFYKGNNYTYWHRIKGNFSSCLSYIYHTLMGKSKKLKVGSYSFQYNNKKYKNKSYNLYNKNCVQVSVQILLKGKFTGKTKSVDQLKRELLNKVKTWGIPNQVYDYLSKNYFFAF